MVDDYKSLILGIVAILGIVFCICYCTKLNVDLDKMYIENGYTRQTLQGSDTAKWVKGEK